VRLAAAAPALLAAVVLVGCGEKEERVPARSPGEAQALVDAGLRAVGSTTLGSAAVTFSGNGPALTLRLGEPPPADGLLRALGHFSRVDAHIVPFCPKPAILGCKPGLQASGKLRPRASADRVVRALRDLARASYDQRPLLRRARTERRSVTAVDIVTANGELLGALRADGHGVRLSFGGPDPPARLAPSPPGALHVEAGFAAIAAMRASLPRRAATALAGVRRLDVVAPL
jgi:hypothetical protein